MIIAIDPGHGMNSANLGLYDPGACAAGFIEAAIALDYGLTLKYLSPKGEFDTQLLRENDHTGLRYTQRAKYAEDHDCDMFVSLHLNADTSTQANGVEVLYRDSTKDKPLAVAMQRELVQTTGFSNRGVKQRRDLAVLKFRSGPAMLIELGFITNEQNRKWLIDRDNRIAVCAAIVRVLKPYEGEQDDG